MTEPLALHTAEEALEAVHTRRYASYPAYKPSGVEWLGDVPEHWVVKRLKRDSAVLRGASPRPIDDPIYFDEDGEYAWVRISDVTAAGVYLQETTQRLSELGASLSVKLQPGDLFLSIAGSVGKPCITKIKCCIHDGFVYFPHLSCDRKFLYYIFASGEPYKGLGKLGTQLNLNTDTVGSIYMGYPSLDEQQAIVRFLDKETKKIDELIEAKRNLLALLKEKRRAVITHAVTRGLDPNTRLEPSGIEWVGKLPEHWNVTPLKYLCKFTGGFTPSTNNSAYWDGSIPWVSPKDMKSWSISDTEDRVTERAVKDVFRSVLEPGAVLLVVRSGILRHSLPVAINAVPVVINQDIKALVTRRQLSNEYLAWLIEGNQKSLLRLWTKPGTTVESIESEYLLNELIPLPPLDEQQAIARFLNEETRKIDDLDSVVREAIASLEVLRTSIISAAVTGKIDVRKAES